MRLALRDGLHPFPLLAKAARNGAPLVVQITQGSCLLRSTGLSSLAHCFYPLDHELEAVAAPFCAGDGGLDVFEGVGVVKFLAQVLHKRVNLRVDQKQFSAESRSEK